MAKRPTSTAPSTSRAQTARNPITLELAAAVCPTEAIAASIARHYGLGPVDYVAVREAHEEAIGTMANVFGETLGEKAKAMHFQRLVGALVTSAWNAGRFYSDKVSEARALTAKLQNDDRDEDSEGVWGFESKAQRARRFAAEMGLQAYTQLAGGGRRRQRLRRHHRRDLETLRRAGQQPDAQPAGCGRRTGCLRRVAKRGELAGSPFLPQRRTARTIVISRRRCDAGRETVRSAERRIDHPELASSKDASTSARPA